MEHFPDSAVERSWQRKWKIVEMQKLKSRIYIHFEDAKFYTELSKTCNSSFFWYRSRQSCLFKDHRNFPKDWRKQEVGLRDMVHASCMFSCRPLIYTSSTVLFHYTSFKCSFSSPGFSRTSTEDDAISIFNLFWIVFSNSTKTKLDLCSRRGSFSFYSWLSFL